MVSNMNLFSSQLIAGGGNVTKNINLRSLPINAQLFIDVYAFDGSGTLKGEWLIRDDSSDTFYTPSSQTDLFTGHTHTTNTNGRDRYKISAPFLGKEVQIKFTNTDGTASVKVTSDLVIA